MGKLEIEVKLRFPDAASARRAILTAGGVEKRSRHFEDNRLFDTPSGNLVGRGALLRLRTASDGQAWLTYKEKVASDLNAKVRDEREVRISSAEILSDILEGAGFVTIYRYQKRRTVFTLGEAVVDLDETPMGCFVEVEAGPGVLERVVAALGASPGDVIKEDYRSLYRRWLEEKGLPYTDMLFPTDTPEA